MKTYNQILTEAVQEISLNEGFGDAWKGLKKGYELGSNVRKLRSGDINKKNIKSSLKSVQGVIKGVGKAKNKEHYIKGGSVGAHVGIHRNKYIAGAGAALGAAALWKMKKSKCQNKCNEVKDQKQKESCLANC